jgi:filamin
VYWNDLPINRFPIIATVEGVCECPDDPVDAKKLSVTGPGLRSARVMEKAQFVIDGTKAGPGLPEVRMIGVQDDIDVTVEPIGPNLYGCTYIPKKSGAYLLSITWCGQQSQYSPYKINVLSSSDATKVVCMGDGLTCGVIGQNLNVLVDARRAGTGELVARCEGPSRQAICDIEDRRDGTYEITIKPHECGNHLLYVTYDGDNVMGSPFTIKVVAAPDASKVTVCGEGIKNGILATFESDFTVNTCGAGPGQLTVKVRAKKGAFRVEMTRSKESDRVIQCRYHPTEIGEYFIHVQWSGQHVPNSPFRVVIVDTIQELRRLGDGGQSMYGGRSGSEFGTISNLGGAGPFEFDDY